MRTVRRALTASLAAALVLGGAALPVLAGLGPVVIDDHESFIATRAFDVSSSTSGTLYGTDIGGYGRMWLVIGAMTTGSPRVDLGRAQFAPVPPQLRGNRVSLPQAGEAFDDPVTVVKSCAIGTCPTMSTFTAPAGTEYVGNAEDRAVVWNATTDTLSLVTWTGGTVTHSWVLSGVEYTPRAEGDLTGTAVSAGGDIFYLARASATVNVLGYGNEVVLTPTYVAWYALGVGESEPYRTKVYRVLRSNPTAPPVEATIAGDPGIGVFAANDTGAAYLVPNGDEDGTQALWTMAWDASPVLYPRPITTSALAAFEGGSTFVVNDRLAGIPGFYELAPGASSGSLTGLLPARPAITLNLAVSNARAVYNDDMTVDAPMFVRRVLDGTVGPETTVTDWTEGGAVGLSGPYVVFTRDGSTASTRRVVYGRVEGPFTTRTLPAAEVGTVGISGRRVFVTNRTRARIIDIPTGGELDLGHAYVGVFGNYAVTVNYDTGKVERRNLSNGSVATIRNAITGCTTECIDEERPQISVWGNDVVYAFETRSGSTIAEHWNGTTGVRSSLTMLRTSDDPQWYELKHWGGLLLVSRVGGEVRLYDLRSSIDMTGVLVDTDAERPLGLDGHVAAWRPNVTLQAVVRDLRDFVPGYVAQPRYLGEVAATGFGPGLGTGLWAPSMLVSQDVDWTLQVRQGGASGTVVHTDTGTSVNGEVKPTWDGTDANTGQPAAQGTYTWVLTGTSDVPGETLTSTNGTSTTFTGTVYFSKAALGAPALSTPTRSTDTSAETSYTINWSPPAGAPAGTRYQVQRSTNGGAFATYTTVGGTSTIVGGTPGTTYRFRVRAIDPAGRLGAMSGTDTTMVPYDDPSGTIAGSWGSGTSSLAYRDTFRRSTAAGSTFSLSARGTQIHLIGTRATTYGKFQVSIDGGAYSAPIDSYSSTTKYRQVLYTKTGLSDATHTIKVRVVGTSGRPAVGIDGVAFLR
ncbi:MAG TPA: fibronectin type III domain-containing protein [Frankiaceae bacterium]|nr:fibronectin type III domain-containing protein [Frankiaceae bacterium]